MLCERCQPISQLNWVILWLGLTGYARWGPMNHGQADALQELARLSRRRTITLIYSAADEAYNQAVVLKELLDKLACSEKQKQRRTL